jgi:hypothetical protein
MRLEWVGDVLVASMNREEYDRLLRTISISEQITLKSLYEVSVTVRTTCRLTWTGPQIAGSPRSCMRRFVVSRRPEEHSSGPKEAGLCICYIPIDNHHYSKIVV